MSTLPLSGVNSRFFSVIPLSRFSLEKSRFFCVFRVWKKIDDITLCCVNASYCRCWLRNRQGDVCRDRVRDMIIAKLNLPVAVSRGLVHYCRWRRVWVGSEEDVRRFRDGEEVLVRANQDDQIIKGALAFSSEFLVLMFTHVAVLRLADRVPDNLFLREEFADYQVSADLPSHTGRLDTFWGEMGNLVEAGEPRFPHLSRLMTTLLVVPAGNASSERVFSQVRKIATNFRSELGRDTLCALLSVKWNVDDSATSFTCSAKLVRSAKSATYRYNQGHWFWNCEFRNSTRSPCDRAMYLFVKCCVFCLFVKPRRARDKGDIRGYRSSGKIRVASRRCTTVPVVPPGGVKKY